MGTDRRGQLDALLDVGLVLPSTGEPPVEVDTELDRPGPRRSRPACELALAADDRLGKYRLERELGRGGMGVVWRARDVELDRGVALKVLADALDGDGVARVRMVREARAMARLHHPNVITVFDAARIEGRDVIAMELVDGETLAAWLARRPRRAAVIDALLAAGRGLAVAHAAGMVHRDFKPHNVLVDRRGRVVVTDFGLARAIGEAAATGGAAPSPGRSSPVDSPLTATGTVMGTPAYMAPEQHAGAVADARADQFAFCASAWEALAGERPFGDTKPAGPPHGRARIPRRFRAVLERGLAIDPAARWPALDPLLAALARAARRPRRIAIGAALTAVAGAIAAVALVRPSAPKPWRADLVDLPAFEEDGDTVAVSPDGKQLAYASNRDEPAGMRLYIEPVTGGDARAVTPPGVWYEAPRWTRDGQALLATTWDKRANRYRIARLPLAGGAPVDLGTGYHADDCGDVVAIADDDPAEGRLELRHPDGHRDVLVRTTTEWILLPRCDRDGRRVVYLRGPAPTIKRAVNNVHVVDRDGRDVQLTTGNNAAAAAFAPDGSLVFAGQLDTGQTSLFTIAADGGQLRRLIPDVGEISPDVSPDGNVLAFMRITAGDLPIIGDGSATRRVSSPLQDLLAIEPAHGGDVVIGDRMGGASEKIVAIDIGDGRVRVLAEGGHPFIARDGEHVWFRPRGAVSTLATVAVAGGAPRVVASLPGELVDGSEGPSGVHLELRRAGNRESWRIDGERLVADGLPGLVVEAPSGGWRALRVQRNGYHVHFLAPDGTDAGHELACDGPRGTWLDDHRFACWRADAFHVVDAASGAEVAVLPGPKADPRGVLAADGVHWYGLESIAHVTRHAITNFDQR